MNRKSGFLTAAMLAMAELMFTGYGPMPRHSPYYFEYSGIDTPEQIQKRAERKARKKARKR